MLQEAPYVVIPLFKAKELSGDGVSRLNPFATIWCVIENILLAAAAEGLSCSMRIPLDKEHDAVKTRLKVPPTYRIPRLSASAMPTPQNRAWNRIVPILNSRCASADGNEDKNHCKKEAALRFDLPCGGHGGCRGIDMVIRCQEKKDRTPELIAGLLDVWESSVRATHRFLSERERERIKRYVPQALR